MTENTALQIAENTVPPEDLPQPTMEKRARILCVASGKGGTGKSFLSAFLSQLVSRQGKNVLLIDADFGMADAHLYLGLKPQKDITVIFNGSGDPESAIAKCNDRLHYIYGGSGMSDLAHLSMLQWMRLLKTFSQLEQKYTDIVIDLAAGVGPQVLPYLLAAEEVVLVTNPDPVALLDAFALLKILKQKGYCDSVYLVVNRAVAVKGDRVAEIMKQGLAKINPDYSVEYIGSISESRALLLALRRQAPFLDLYPYDPAAIDLKKIAARLIQRGENRSERPTLSYFLRVKQAGEKR